MKRSDNTFTKTFDSTFIVELLDSFNIVEVIKEYIPLTAKGQNFVSRCPFHSEDTPSFVVSPEKGIYHCFGCGKGGNLIKFLMEREGLTYFESVAYLADKCGKVIPNTTTSKEYSDFIARQKELIKINNLTLAKWKENLAKDGDVGDYLDARGVSDASKELFQLGLASKEWTEIHDLLISKGITEDSLKESGVCTESKGRVYDVFRDRIITPIFDVQARLVAFGGRTRQDKGKEAKYVNSADTPLYNKKKHLYGLNITKDSIRDKGFALITEGYFDLIALYQGGVTNVVAGLGTAFTPQQAKLLKRYTQKVVLCYDADNAGYTATERAIKILQAEGFIIKVMELPKGKDPDDYIKEVGLKGFNEQRGKAISWFKYLIDRASQHHDLSNPTDKAKLLEKVKEIVNYSTTDLEKKEYFSMAMGILKIDKKVAQVAWKSINNDSTPIVEKEELPPPSLAETKLLQLMLHCDDRKGVLKEVKPYLQDSYVRKLALILGNVNGEFRYNIAESLLSNDDDRAFLRKLTLNADDDKPKAENIKSDIDNCISAIKRDSLTRQMEEVNALIKEHCTTVVSDNWESELNDLFTKQVSLSKEHRALR